MNEYYPISVKYKGETAYAVWFTGQSEGLVCEGGKLLTFSDLTSLVTYAKDSGFSLSATLHKTYDLDALADFISDEDRYADSAALDCWSLFADLSASLGKPFAGGGNSFILNDIYEKLCMAGIDFEGIADEDDETDDRFDLTPEEESMTKAVLKTGIELYDRYRSEVSR
ncbi:MAG: hypothetical protein ACI3XR_09725 [Eubacteriales bacterium]